MVILEIVDNEWSLRGAGKVRFGKGRVINIQRLAANSFLETWIENGASVGQEGVILVVVTTAISEDWGTLRLKNNSERSPHTVHVYRSAASGDAPSCR